MPTREECLEAAADILADAIAELNDSRMAGVSLPSG